MPFLEKLIPYPLYKDDAVPTIALNDKQKKAVASLNQKINNGEYKLVENPCLCGNEKPKNDLVISLKDRCGVSLVTVLCSKCGLPRTEKILDDVSTIEYYKHEYRPIHDIAEINQDYFNAETVRGQGFFQLFNQYVQNKKGLFVVEVGCGAGGNLFPFFQAGHKTTGCDYDENYLAFGRSKGLDLKFGDYKTIIQDNSVDLLILSHVMEHFPKPIPEMIEIIKKIKPNRYLLVEVPGLYYKTFHFYNPMLQLQHAHIFNYFYKDFLKMFYKKLGLNILFGNERCTFLLQKPENWIVPKVDFVYDDSLTGYFQKNKNYLFNRNLLTALHLHPKVWKRDVVKILRFFGG